MTYPLSIHSIPKTPTKHNLTQISTRLAQSGEITRQPLATPGAASEPSTSSTEPDGNEPSGLPQWIVTYAIVEMIEAPDEADVHRYVEALGGTLIEAKCVGVGNG